MKTNMTERCCNLDDFVKVMADESRQRILKLLESGEMNVQELTAHLGLSQPTVSYHLARLRRANVVAVRREGRQAYYSANPACVSECCQEILKRFVPNRPGRMTE
jgi:DNA-binding transcriptional ArsR family regulator